jgi:hypothetical protein
MKRGTETGFLGRFVAAHDSYPCRSGRWSRRNVRDAVHVFLWGVLILCLATPALKAQATGSGHFQAGAFAEYFRLARQGTTINFVGGGGRFGFNLGSRAQLEIEMAGDFARNFSSPFTAGAATLPVNTRLKTFQVLAGPKFNFGSDRLRPFFTIKGGWVNFTATNLPPPNFVSDLGRLTSGGRSFAMYPAFGLEGFRGPWGVRFELGDELYYDGNIRSNLRVTLGPQFRF